MRLIVAPFSKANFYLLELSTSNFILLLKHFFIFATYFEISRLFNPINCLTVVFESLYIFIMCVLLTATIVGIECSLTLSLINEMTFLEVTLCESASTPNLFTST